MSLGIGVATWSIFAPNQHVLAKGDKCLVNKDGEFGICDTDKKSSELSNEAKRDCREGGGPHSPKCSSSQTGYGEFDNFKPNKEP